MEKYKIVFYLNEAGEEPAERGGRIERAERCYQYLWQVGGEAQVAFSFAVSLVCIFTSSDGEFLFSPCQSVSVCSCRTTEAGLYVSITDAVTKRFRRAVEFKIKAEFQDGCDPTHEYSRHNVVMSTEGSVGLGSVNMLMGVAATRWSLV